MKRTQPLRATGPDRATVKLRKCPVKKGGCGVLFVPARQKQIACMADGCAQAVGAWQSASKAKAFHKEEVKQTRAQLEALKTIPQLKKEAQREFNRFIRARDRRAERLCICCDRPLEWERIGGTVDAGHYRSTGSADHLRFDEDNCAAQRSDCNRFGAGRAVDYRAGLIRRIGRERVEALEAKNDTAKWTREGLREIRDGYRRKAKEMEQV